MHGSSNNEMQWKRKRLPVALTQRWQLSTLSHHWVCTVMYQAIWQYNHQTRNPPPLAFCCFTHTYDFTPNNLPHGSTVHSTSLPFDGPTQFFKKLVKSVPHEQCVYMEPCQPPSLLAPPLLLSSGLVQVSVLKRFFAPVEAEELLGYLDEQGYPQKP